MKKTYICLIAIFAFININVQAQAPRIPEASPTQTIIQDFGLGKITITYSRPSVKGRVIFGGINLISGHGLAYGKNANAATVIKFQLEKCNYGGTQRTRR